MFILAVYMDAEDEQLLEDEVTVPTDSKRFDVHMVAVISYINKNFSS